MTFSAQLFIVIYTGVSNLSSSFSVLGRLAPSVRADTDMYQLSAPIWTFCRYIGFADKAIAYHQLSVSADMVPHIGS